MNIIRVTVGNFLEAYDFMLFGYFASAISRAYFPGENPLNALLLTFATFGAAFFMRPLGAIILGAYVDKKGRRAGLLLVLGLMSVGTLAIAIMPTYHTIGIAAVLLILISRLVQGLSAGVELGTVSIYLAEIAPLEKKAFYVSWQSASQQLATVLATSLGIGMTFILPPEEMQNWGWRVPFFLGSLLLPFAVKIRLSLQETKSFFERQPPSSFKTIWLSVAKNWTIILTGMGIILMTTISFYFIAVYTPTFGQEILHLSQLDSLLVTLVVGVNNFIWLPLSGVLSDRIGRRSILITCTVLTVLTAYPALLWLTQAPSFPRLLLTELWLSLLYANYNGAAVCYLTEIVPINVRATSFSLAYSLATTAGGFTPFISTYLIAKMHNPAVPGVWLSCAALVSFMAVLFGKKPTFQEYASKQ